MSSHWDSYIGWDLVGAPLRPTRSVIQRYAELVEGQNSLGLLGCTPELLDLRVPTIVAMDNSEARAATWPCAVMVDDWRHPRDLFGPFDSIIGDGSFTCLQFPDEWEMVLRNCRANQVIIRVFENYESARQDEPVLHFPYPNFHCLKLDIAMLLAKNNNGHVPVRLIWEWFNHYIPRESLHHSTGWPVEVINIIDVYQNSPDVYAFPTQAMIQRAFPTAKRLHMFGYPFAEYCPIYIF